MNIDKSLSERLNVLRFPLVIGIVFIHAYGISVTLSSDVVGIQSQSYLSEFIQNLISQGIARISVPLFFLMSGYFFFLNTSFSIETYGKKLHSRFKTLLIPYIFWNFFILLMIALAQSIPETKVFFSGEKLPIALFGLFDYLNAIFGFNRFPISYQFWFIRDLLIIILLTPLVHLIAKIIPNIALIGIFLVWFFYQGPTTIPSVTAVTFFYAGAYCASCNISLFAFDRIGLAIFSMYLPFLLADTLTKEYYANDYIHKIGIILGIVSTLYLSKLLVKFKYLKVVLMWLGTCSFFIFAVHEPLLTVIKKIVYSVVSPNSDILILFLYFSIPIFVIAISILLYFVMSRLTPRILDSISGGR